MPDLIPFAVIHIGVSVALAAILILVHRRLHKADFLHRVVPHRTYLTRPGLSRGGGVQWS